MPKELYEALAERARRARRSLAQQAIADLSAIEELQARERREGVIARLRHGANRGSSLPDPVALVREDRDR